MADGIAFVAYRFSYLQGKLRNVIQAFRAPIFLRAQLSITAKK